MRGLGKLSQALTIALALSFASVARAAGGAHVIDDSELEAPGVCHLESWAARLNDGVGLVNLGPACTPEGWPKLEIGGFVQRAWTTDSDVTTIGPALKLSLRPVESGVGVAAAGAAGFNARDGKLETASLLGPLTMDLNETLRANVNLGWSYTREAAHEHAFTWGAQLDWRLSRGWSLMSEAFGRDRGYPGIQTGLRRTFANGAADLDFLIGRKVDGLSNDSATIGLTVRSGN